MKSKQNKSASLRPSPRLWSLHARLTPQGPDAADRKAFWDFWMSGLALLSAKAARKLAEEKAQFARVKTAYRRIGPIFLQVYSGRLPLDVGVQKIRRLVPDVTVAREAIGLWTAGVQASPRDMARQQEKAQTLKAEHARLVRLRKADRALDDGLSALSQAVAAGDAEAARRLVEVAVEAVRLVAEAGETRPDLMRSVAHQVTQWPMLAGEEPGWEEEAVERVAALDLGSGLRHLNVRFRQARGADINLPARLWAKAAVRTIEETRWRLLAFDRLRDGLGSAEDFDRFCRKAGWKRRAEPAWLSAVAQLAPFSRDSLPQWKPVVRNLIREQWPSFHTRSEWSTQRNTAIANGRDTPGELQNAILDDIVSSLARLAPVRDLLNFTC